MQGRFWVNLNAKFIWNMYAFHQWNRTHEKYDLSSELREAGFWFFGGLKKKIYISVCKSSRIYLKCFLIGTCILSTVKYTVHICTMMIYLFMSFLYILKCCAIRISQSIFKGITSILRKNVLSLFILICFREMVL